MDAKLVVGIVGGIVLAGALVAILMHEAGSAPEPTFTYELDWPVEAGPTTTRSDTLEEDENASYQVDLSASNVTIVEVRLTWDDDVGEPDTFNLTVRPPGGPERTNRSDNGTVVLRFGLSEVPELAQTNATSRAQAVDRLTQDHARDAGQGTWRIRVGLEDAPGQRPVPGAPQLEVQSDGSNSFDLGFRYQAYRVEMVDRDAPA